MVFVVSLSPPWSLLPSCLLQLFPGGLSEKYYQHCFLPYAADMTHTEDTLFLVFEPDYCGRQEDEEARLDFINAVNMESAGVESLDELGDFLNDAAVK